METVATGLCSLYGGIWLFYDDVLAERRSKFRY